MPSALLMITYQIRHCELLRWLSCQPPEQLGALGDGKEVIIYLQ